MTRETADFLTDLIAALVLIEIIVATLCVTYFAREYLRSDRKSRMFKTVVRDDVLKIIAGSWVGVLAILRLGPFPDEFRLPAWTSPITAVVLVILLLPPIDHAFTTWRLKRRGESYAAEATEAPDGSTVEPEPE